MELKEILSRCDHTLLAQGATFEEIKALCDDGIRFGTASVCIPACYVRRAKEYVGSKLKICTVIGFPNGYDPTPVKCFETALAVADGADEIDMVINIGMVKERRYADVTAEINAVKDACAGRLLKVIIETCLLTEEEKIAMCKAVSDSRAEYIKTSTGFSKGGATKEDVALMKKYCAPHIKIKAAGGISSIEDAEDFINLGASRLGTSRIVKIAKELNK
ncbi:MAG: deoxyribose-phosphate aldolase [Clostridia bacterium]|nr:deoxyribose-phosphate aldolase [Clostridia bacterium]